MENRLHRIREVRENWGWFLAFGVLLVMLGLGVMGAAYYATLFSMLLLGVFLIAGGIIQIIQSLLARKWSGLFLSLFLGVLYIVTGVLCMIKPMSAAASITLLFAAFCFVAGLFRMLGALLLRFEHWEWVFFNGFITFLLGLVIYADWPISGLWVIGLFVGIDMILSGWSWIMLSSSARLKGKADIL